MKRAVLLAGLASCTTFAPVDTATQLPASYENASGSSLNPETEYWKSLADPALDSLIAQALAANRDLKRALLRIEQARFVAAAAGAYKTPSVLLSTSAKESSQEKAGVRETQFDLGVSGQVSWELDFFGKWRHAQKAATFRSEALRLDAEGLILILCADVCSAVIDLRAARQQVAVEGEALASIDELIGAITSKVRGGQNTEADLQRAKALRGSSESRIQELQGQQVALLAALSILTSLPPQEVAAALEVSPGPVTSFDLGQVGLPSELLTRRPDVKAAFSRVQAASQDLASSLRARYPSFNLLGLVSWLAQPDSSWVGSVQAMASWLALDQVTALAPYARDAAAREAAVAYQDAVHKAFNEAQESLSRLRFLMRECSLHQEAVRSGELAFELVSLQYQAGLIDFLTLYDTQRSLIALKAEAAQKRARLLKMQVAAYKALGVGARGVI